MIYGFVAPLSLIFEDIGVKEVIIIIIIISSVSVHTEPQ